MFVIACGDFDQFLPVINNRALYIVAAAEERGDLRQVMEDVCNGET